VGSIRAIWAIQDPIALDADGEKAVEVKREMVAGQERLVLNPALSLAAKNFEFPNPEVARIKAAIETRDSYGANADRRWLQPLVETLFSAHRSNEKRKTTMNAGARRATTMQDLTIGISVVTIVSGAINVYVVLRPAALQAQIKANPRGLTFAETADWADVGGCGTGPARS